MDPKFMQYILSKGIGDTPNVKDPDWYKALAIKTLLESRRENLERGDNEEMLANTMWKRSQKNIPGREMTADVAARKKAAGVALGEPAPSLEDDEDNFIGYDKQKHIKPWKAYKRF